MGNLLKGILIFLALFIGVPLFLAFAGLINLPFLGFEKKIDLNTGVITKTYDTDYCLANYEYFKETYQAIQGMDDKITIEKQAMTDFTNSAGTDRSKWSFTDKQTWNDIENKITGLQNSRVSMVNEYDAKTQELNRVACKELPLFVKP